MGIALERMGLEADFVDNGVAALARLQEAEYDIVFLDIMMEGMDGYKVCKFIKAKASTKDIPVVMLTSRDGAIDKIRGKLAGADHYLTKPVKMSEFRATIERFVPIDTRQAAEAKRTAPQRPTQPVKLRSVPPIKPATPAPATPAAAVTSKKAEAVTKDASKGVSKKVLSREEKIAQIRKMMEKK